MKAQTVTIKQLHAKTGELVRGAVRVPVRVTDRGAVVAVLEGPSFIVEPKRHRSLLAEYAALLKREPTNDVLQDLEVVRDR